MPVTINGDGSITGLSAGGLPAGSVTDATIAGMAASKLSGALPAISGASLTGLSSGLSMADQWRLSSDSGENNGVMAHSNWERCDSYGFGQLGTGMTESSGVFTFPSTGIYRIDAQGSSKRTDNITIPEIDLVIQSTTDNSSYNALSMSTGHIGGANNSYAVAYCSAIFDVTSVSTHKIKLYCNATHPTNFRGNDNTTRTGLMFLRLGDT